MGITLEQIHAGELCIYQGQVIKWDGKKWIKVRDASDDDRENLPVYT